MSDSGTWIDYDTGLVAQEVSIAEIYLRQNQGMDDPSAISLVPTGYIGPNLQGKWRSNLVRINVPQV